MGQGLKALGNEGWNDFDMGRLIQTLVVNRDNSSNIFIKENTINNNPDIKAFVRSVITKDFVKATEIIQTKIPFVVAIDGFKTTYRQLVEYNCY